MVHKLRAFLVAVVLIGLLGLIGCETAKGFSRDMDTAWQELVKADTWVRKNLW